MSVTVISHFFWSQWFICVTNSSHCAFLNGCKRSSCPLWPTMATEMETIPCKHTKKFKLYFRSHLSEWNSPLPSANYWEMISLAFLQRSPGKWRELIRQAGCAGVMYEPLLCIRIPATQSRRLPSRQTFGPKWLTKGTWKLDWSAWHAEIMTFCVHNVKSTKLRNPTWFQEPRLSLSFACYFRQNIPQFWGRKLRFLDKGKLDCLAD